MTSEETSDARVAYLVLSHQHPTQVELLAARICRLDPNAWVYVHHDARAISLPWAGRALPARCVLLPRPVRVRWGRWSIVRATLLLYDAARASGRHDWYALISGEDWPILDLASWAAALARTDLDVICEASPIVDRPEDQLTAVEIELDEYRRYNDRWLVVSNPQGRWRRKAFRAAAKAVAAAVNHVGPRRLSCFLFYDRGAALGWHRSRRLPPDWTLFKGPQWLAFNQRAADALQGERGPLVAHFRRTLIPDESCLQTLFRNTAGLRTDGGALSWAPWYQFAQRPDLYLQAEDLPLARAAGAVFARKVAVNRPDVIAAADALVGRAD